MNAETIARTVCACMMFGLFAGQFSCTTLEPHSPDLTNKPNVILVITDDQGIGDLGCHGNPWLKTPNLDAFAAQAVRLVDFHVSPVCTPTRSALMTGQYPIHNGAWATYKGRDALPNGSRTMPEFFAQADYRTGLFGKWHLGDNYPSRPIDCGFDLAVQHKAGGVGELSDYWGNSYFDDIYYVNEKPQQFEGYCTDVWFTEAMKFMEQDDNRPFFTYLSTNAPHSPFIVDSSYAAPYRSLEGEKIVGANFYGMLANLDENFGRLEQFLVDHKLRDNTILIFMTDNGSGGGMSKDETLGHNHGFRGSKGHKTEGGHRVPFFIRWADGNIVGDQEVKELLAHVDVLPTLAHMCGLDLGDWPVDGVDFSSLLQDEGPALWEDRTVFVHHNQDWRPPQDVNETCIMTEEWRLVNGAELYRIDADRYQEDDLSAQHPEVVSKLLASNQSFVDEAKLRETYQQFPSPVIGTESQDELKLTIQHAIGEGGGIWKAEHVAAGMKNVNNRHAIEIARDGMYEISCRRWPDECPGLIWGVPDCNPKGGMYTYETIRPEKVRIQIGNQIHEKRVEEDDVAVDFLVNLEKGKMILTNDFVEGNEAYGVYYTYVSVVH